jgi:hypothetical protein
VKKDALAGFGSGNPSLSMYSLNISVSMPPYVFMCMSGPTLC